MFEVLSKKLTQVLGTLGIKRRLSESNIEDAMREIRTALIEADVALPVIKTFVARVKEKALGTEVLQSVEPGQLLVKILHDELVGLLGGETSPSLKLPDPSQTAVVLVCGLQGAGKTTTCGKLALALKATRDVVLVSLDTHRPAAADQLRILSEQAGVDYYDRGTATDPKVILEGARAHAKRQVRNLILVDTAGRTQVDEAMLAELSQVHGWAKPHETVLVADSMTGQRALAIAKAFQAAVPLTSVIFTKFDSDTRGGAVLSVKETLGLPIPFVGTGEAIQGLAPFDARRTADRMLGMGDIVGLVEKAQSVVNEAEAQALAEKIKKNSFDLSDFLSQLNQVEKMGGMGSILEMLPGVGGHAEAMKAGMPQMKRMKAMIQSMTLTERSKPFLLTNSRRHRVARGSGTSVLEVNGLIKRFDEMRGMMRKMNNPAKMKQMMAQMGLPAQDPSAMAKLERLIPKS